MFLCALLPETPRLWGPAVIFLFTTGHPWKAGILLVWGVLAVSSVDNLLRPMFIGRGVKLPVMLIFLGTLGGMLAFGLIGLFTGPLVITIFLFLLEVVRRDFFRGVSQGAEP
jgi:predicted PurR-regulated permease PerM